MRPGEWQSLSTEYDKFDYDVGAPARRPGEHPEQRYAGGELRRDHHLSGGPFCWHHRAEWDLQDGFVSGTLQRRVLAEPLVLQDRKSTRLNSSHVAISYAVFC